jgi:hypothetical protein
MRNKKAKSLKAPKEELWVYLQNEYFARWWNDEFFELLRTGTSQEIIDFYTERIKENKNPNIEPWEFEEWFYELDERVRKLYKSKGSDAITYAMIGAAWMWAPNAKEETNK